MAQDQREVRLEKLQKLRAQGVEPFADRFPVEQSLAECRAAPDGTRVVVAGRLLVKRVFGKLVFAHLQDRTGRLQLSFERDSALPAEQFQRVKSLFDIGDVIGVRGEMWTTDKGERTVRVLDVTLLAKALRPLPEKWHGLADREACYRQRYLDLIANEATRERFVFRSRMVAFLRRWLDDHGFLEVETPILQAASSGAAARPFVTHHNALDRDFFLRISPETYLKRLIVGGLERVYEIGKNFRNEGIDPSHLQEFTMLEWYAAYWDFRDNMRFVREMIQTLLEELCGTTRIVYRGVELDFGGEWPEVSFCGAVEEATGIDPLAHDFASLRAAVAERLPDFDLENVHSYPALLDALYKRTVRPSLVQPCFLTFHPTELVPLARRNAGDPRVLDMFQVVVNTWEIVKAYSELVDPIDQRARMLEQQRYREAGDEETMMMEEDYIVCMEHGMPPNSGLGLGIDRLVALLTDADTLRDVVFFPALREEAPAGGEGDAPAARDA